MNCIPFETCVRLRFANRTYDLTKVMTEPVSREFRDLLERARLLEQMGGAGNNHEFLRADKPGMGLLVEFDHNVIVPADNQ